MEDAATAEIARALLWLWRARGTALDDGRVVDDALYASSVMRSWRGSAEPGRAASARRPKSSMASS
jgi:malate synthase